MNFYCGFYRRSVQEYSKALSIVQHNDARLEQKLTKSLMNNYHALGNANQENAYRKKYDSLQEIYNLKKERAFDKIVDVSEEVGGKHNPKQSVTDHEQWILAGLAILSLAISLLFIGWFKKRAKYNRQLIKQQAERIERLQASQSLKNKDDTIDHELLKLAKKNAPALLWHYQQHHAIHYGQLTQKKYKLTKKELRLCIMISLGLSNDQIAKSMGIQSRSLQVMKYRLRKKVNLPKGENLSRWIQQLS